MFKDKDNYYWIIYLIAAPVIIYYYFLKYKTTAIYGDDLSVLNIHFQVKGFIATNNAYAAMGKFRPITVFCSNFLIEHLPKNLNAYYIVNISIQTLNTFIFAYILNIFTKSFLISCFFSFTVGLSRFALFDITQLYIGGILEGFAMTFCLLSLLFVLKAVKNTNEHIDTFNEDNAHRYISLIWSILFANLSMYTHERYIVILPFILMIILFFPGINKLKPTQRVYTGILAFISIPINIAIKKLIYGQPFLVGTGGSNISFSPATTANFFTEAIYTIFQVNKGPDYLVGFPVSFFSPPYRVLVIFFAWSIVLLFILYVINAFRNFYNKTADSNINFPVFLFLSGFLVMLLVPAHYPTLPLSKDFASTRRNQ